jgi:hypothetical protein
MEGRERESQTSGVSVTYCLFNYAICSSEETVWTEEGRKEKEDLNYKLYEAPHTLYINGLTPCLGGGRGLFINAVSMYIMYQ